MAVLSICLAFIVSTWKETQNSPIWSVALLTARIILRELWQEHCYIHLLKKRHMKVVPCVYVAVILLIKLPKQYVWYVKLAYCWERWCHLYPSPIASYSFGLWCLPSHPGYSNHMCSFCLTSLTTSLLYTIFLGSCGNGTFICVSGLLSKSTRVIGIANLIPSFTIHQGGSG